MANSIWYVHMAEGLFLRFLSDFVKRLYRKLIAVIPLIDITG